MSSVFCAQLVSVGNRVATARNLDDQQRADTRSGKLIGGFAASWTGLNYDYTGLHALVHRPC
jgi:hypothetical protein